MQKGTHRHLDYEIRKRTPTIEAREADDTELRKCELKEIAAAFGLDINLMIVRNRGPLNKHQLRTAIANTALGEDRPALYTRTGRFTKEAKRDLKEALGEVSDS